MRKFFLVAFATACLALTACSTTVLQCGVDGDKSYVYLVDLPKDFAAASAQYSELCGFSFDQED